MPYLSDRFVTRQQIIAEIGRGQYERAIEARQLTPLKARNVRANAKVRVERAQYEQYIRSLQ